MVRHTLKILQHLRRKGLNDVPNIKIDQKVNYRITIYLSKINILIRSHLKIIIIIQESVCVNYIDVETTELQNI